MPWLPPLLAADPFTSDPWANEFFGLGEDERFVVLLVGISCFTVVTIILVSIIGSVVSGVHRRNAEYDLKREMLERGMSAEEIAQVVEAAPLPEDGVDRWIASWSKSRRKKHG